MKDLAFASLVVFLCAFTGAAGYMSGYQTARRETIKTDRLARQEPIKGLFYGTFGP